ncbi:MAG: hypothetical protein H6581_25070 [Bacteroidia bacterium]|nr:hypothetical protein [Bacteroidia bacterium]
MGPGTGLGLSAGAGTGTGTGTGDYIAQGMGRAPETMEGGGAAGGRRRAAARTEEPLRQGRRHAGTARPPALAPGDVPKSFPY